MVNLLKFLNKKRVSFVLVSMIIVLIALQIFPVNVIDVEQLAGLPYPRAIPTSGKQLVLARRGNKVVFQTFKPQAGNISGVGIFFSKKTKRPQIGNIYVSILHRENNSFKILALIKKDARLIQVPATNTLFFKKPIRTIKNDTYAIKVEGGAFQMGITPFVSLVDVYKNGQAYLDKAKTGKDIVFQTYYQTRLLQYFSKGSSFNLIILGLSLMVVFLGISIVAAIFEISYNA